jgi:protein ImuB
VPLVETLEFPDAVAQELTLRRGLGVLVDGLLARPVRAGRPPRKLALWARLVGGASWRRVVTLREPTADPARLRLALGTKLAELPAPVLKLRLEAMELADSGGEQLELVRAVSGLRSSDEVRGRLKQGLRQVKAAVGVGGVSMVVEVAPWSRIPEARALLVPRDD